MGNVNHINKKEVELTLDILMGKAPNLPSIESKIKRAEFDGSGEIGHLASLLHERRMLKKKLEKFKNGK